MDADRIFNREPSREDEAPAFRRARVVPPAGWLVGAVLLLAAAGIVGWGLVGVGIWLLCAQFIGPILSDLLYWLGVEYQYIDYYLNQIPTLVVAGVLIWLGLRMLRRADGRKGRGILHYPDLGVRGKGDRDNRGAV